MITVQSAGLTDIGRRRTSNEDSIHLDDERGLYVVADGMGGHQAGEVASRLVVTSLLEFLRNGRHTATGCAEVSPLSPLADRLRCGIAWSNRVVHAAAGAQPTCRGMGSTVAVVALGDDTLVAANVGDSPIYLVRNGQIDLLSVPHTLRADLPGEPVPAALRNVLTRAVGPHPQVDADVCEINCYRGDVLVIGSDGLSNKVAPQEIMAIVSSRPPAEACRELIDLANARGGDDNISALVIQVTGVRRKGPSRLARLAAALKRRVMPGQTPST